MAKMRHNGTVMEASSHRYHLDFHGTEDEYSDGKAKLFSRTMDPERHRKVVTSTFMTQMLISLFRKETRSYQL
ncbi:hypothetical protein ACOSQ2_024801 [Xanthoceras sorbifolium]